MADVLMPQLGETVAEGKIIAWFKKAGDPVKEGDRLFEVETDKVTVDVEAIAAGTLSEIRVGDGVTAKVGAVVAVIGDGGPAGAFSAPKPPPRAFDEVKTAPGNFGKARGPGDIRVTPLARRLIAESGVDRDAIARDIAKLGGTKIAEADVRAALAARPMAQQVQGEAVPLNAIRQRTADRLAENWRTIPHVFQAIEVDFTAVEAVRQRRKDAFRAATGMALTYLPFIARAAALAISVFPNINARFDGKGLLPQRDINIGIAVDLDHQGLVVPVVRSAGDYTTEGLAKAINRQVEKARSGKLGADDLTGGTYSITNNGAFGTLFTSPIINAPQVGILSIDAIRKRPQVVSTPEGDFIAPRLTGVLGQSFDHRAFDGAYSASFLSELKKLIETHAWDKEFAAGA